jgi:hypothetical protein
MVLAGSYPEVRMRRDSDRTGNPASQSDPTMHFQHAALLCLFA